MTNEASPRPVRGVMAIISSFVGTGLLVWGLLEASIVPVVIGALLVLAALILSIVRLLHGRNRAIAAATLVICLVAVAVGVTLSWVGIVAF